MGKCENGVEWFWGSAFETRIALLVSLKLNPCWWKISCSFRIINLSEANWWKSCQEKKIEWVLSQETGTVLHFPLCQNVWGTCILSLWMSKHYCLLVDYHRWILKQIKNFLIENKNFQPSYSSTIHELFHLTFCISSFCK